jgi:hypothetical protein
MALGKGFLASSTDCRNRQSHHPSLPTIMLAG